MEIKRKLGLALIGSMAHNAGLVVGLLHVLAVAAVVVWLGFKLFGASTSDGGFNSFTGAVVGGSMLALVLGYLFNKPEWG